MDTSPNLDREISRVVSASLVAAGFSEVKASERTGIPRTTLKRRLAGLDSFKTSELARIALLLGVKVSDLIERAEHAA